MAQIPTIHQLTQSAQNRDNVIIATVEDLISVDIIAAAEAETDYEVVYDIEAALVTAGATGALQITRIIAFVKTNLTNKGYTVVQGTDESEEELAIFTITWFINGVA